MRRLLPATSAAWLALCAGSIAVAGCGGGGDPPLRTVRVAAEAPARITGFPGGEQRDTTVAVKPGRLRFVCTVADHEELEMEGVLVVRP